jgi:membrane protein
VAARLWRQVGDGRLSLIAAGCAFYATLALFPGMSMLISLYGLVFDPGTVVTQLNVLRVVLPPEAFTLIERQVNALVAQPHVDLRLNVFTAAAVTLWSASIGTKSILAAIGYSHGHGGMSLVRYQVTGLALTLCAALAAVLTIAILVALPQVTHLLDPSWYVSDLLHAASLAVLVGFVGASIVALYRVGQLSDHHIRPRLLPGALAATVLWLAASVLFSVYVGKIARFDATYGPLAAVAGVMLWFWVSTYIVLLGAELNAALALPATTR